MTVGASHQQVGPQVLCQSDNLIRTRTTDRQFNAAFSTYAVPREIMNDIVNVSARSVYLILLTDLNDGDVLRFLKKWQRILNCSPCLTAFLHPITT